MVMVGASELNERHGNEYAGLDSLPEPSSYWHSPALGAYDHDADVSGIGL